MTRGGSRRSTGRRGRRPERRAEGVVGATPRDAERRGLAERPPRRSSARRRARTTARAGTTGRCARRHSHAVTWIEMATTATGRKNLVGWVNRRASPNTAASVSSVRARLVTPPALGRRRGRTGAGGADGGAGGDRSVAVIRRQECAALAPTTGPTAAVHAAAKGRPASTRTHAQPGRNRPGRGAASPHADGSTSTSMTHEKRVRQRDHRLEIGGRCQCGGQDHQRPAAAGAAQPAEDRQQLAVAAAQAGEVLEDRTRHGPTRRPSPNRSRRPSSTAGGRRGGPAATVRLAAADTMISSAGGGQTAVRLSRSNVERDCQGISSWRIIRSSVLAVDGQCTLRRSSPRT